MKTGNSNDDASCENSSYVVCSSASSETEQKSTVDMLQEILARMATKDDLEKMATKDDLKNVKDDLKKMATKDDLKNVKDDLKKLNKDVQGLTTSLGAQNERYVRKMAENMFGRSFAKPFLVKRLHDVVHLVTKAKYGSLQPDAAEERMQVADKLAARAKEFAVPLVEVFLIYVRGAVQGMLEPSEHPPGGGEIGGIVAKAGGHFEKKNFEKCLGTLMGVSEMAKLKNLPVKIRRL